MKLRFNAVATNMFPCDGGIGCGSGVGGDSGGCYSYFNIIPGSIVMIMLLSVTLSTSQAINNSSIFVITSGDQWSEVVTKTEILLPNVINLTITNFEDLINSFCDNHSKELIIVLDTRTHNQENSLLIVCEQLFIPYISVYGFLPRPDTSMTKSAKILPPALSMSASFTDYRALFSDLIKRINISLETLTVIYDADNKALTSIFDSYNEQDSTFFLTYRISSVIYDDVFVNLQSKLDARNFLAFGNKSALELVWAKLFNTYIEDSVSLIDTVIGDLLLDNNSQHTPWNICCPLTGCTMHNIGPSIQFMEKAVNTQFYGCTGPFSFDPMTGHRQVTFGLYSMNKYSVPELFGYWNQTSGLVMFDKNDSYQRNWHFKTLRAITLIEPPFVVLKNGTYQGYTIDVFKEVVKTTSYTYVISECMEKNFGFMYANNTWGGCIGQVLRGDADVIVGSLSVTTERDAVVDFTLPYFDFAGIQIMAKKKSLESHLFYFIDVFHLNVWLCLMGVLITTSILLYMFDRFSPFNTVDKTVQRRVFDMKESMWFVIGSLTQSGGGDPPSSFSSRVLVAGFWFFCIIMMSTFTANLAAFLTARRYTSDLGSLDDLAAQTKINFSVLANSSTMLYFERMAKIENLFDTNWKNMNFRRGSDGYYEENLAVWNYPISEKNANIWKRIKANGMVSNTSEGVDRVRKGGFAFITESPIVDYYTRQFDDLTSIGIAFSSRPYAFAFKQNSELVDIFSKRILQLQQNSFLEELKKKWWPNKASTGTKGKSSEGLSVESLSGTFIVLGIGLACSLLFLVLEVLWDKYKKSENRLPEPTNQVSIIYDRACYQKESTNFFNGSMFTYANPAFQDSGFK